MALTDENGSNMVMPVAPMCNSGNGGFGNGFGGDWAWIILLLLIGGNGWGFGGFGMGGMLPMMMGGMGMGGFGLDYLYPWLNNSQHISDGFRDQQLQTSIGTLQNSVTAGFGDVQLGIAGINQNLCQTGNNIVAAVSGAQNALSQQLYNGEIANLNRSFAEQQANQQGFNGVTSGIADLRYTEATEACATRSAAYQNTRDIIDSQTRGIQTILDKLCQLELDGVKSQVAAEQRENANLRTELMYARGQASQIEQTAALREGQVAAVDSLYNRLNSCPVPSTPVYGRVPIFTCNGNNGGCGCNGNGYGFAA